MTQAQLEQRRRRLTRLDADYRAERIETESSLALEAYTDGWNDGFRAGWAATRRAVHEAIGRIPSD